jgi:STE24 endopeptidase
MDAASRRSGSVKEYQKKKQTLSIFSLFLTPFLLAIFILTPIESIFKFWSLQVSSFEFVQLAVYFSLLSIFFLIFDFPLSYYSGYVLEHRYHLSNQSLKQWLSFSFKKSMLAFVLSLALLSLLYSLIRRFEANWWILAWAGYAVVSYVMGKLFPVFIVPMFYKYDQLKEGNLRNRILALTQKYHLPVENLYTLNLSKTTKKANAAFMGIGKTKRVVLSDTLIENFTDAEIEIVVAHELGHYQHRDILKQILLGLVTSFIGFFVAFQGLNAFNHRFYEGVGDLSSLPVLFFIFTLLGLVWTPLQSAFSRKMEYAADAFAVQSTKALNVFASCMTKLAEVNFSDPDPNPVYEWYFYSHPSIKKRILAAREIKLT